MGPIAHCGASPTGAQSAQVGFSPKAAIPRGADARRESREFVQGAGRLAWDASTGAREAQVVVRNLSPGGLQLVSRKRVDVGVVAYLTGAQFQCLGSIRYCRSTPEGYLVGLCFTRDPFFKNSVSSGE